MDRWITDGDPGLSYIELIGMGGFGEVHKVCFFTCLLITKLRETPPSTEHEIFARKVVYLRSDDDSDLLNELRAVGKLCNKYHKNIVEVLAHGKLQTAPLYAIDMELCHMSLEKFIKGDFDGIQTPQKSGIPSIYQRGSLGCSEMIKKWRDIIGIMTDILRGLKFIHAYGEVHRDLKPANSTSATYSS
jgi:serine/threonine protein kinase